MLVSDVKIYPNAFALNNTGLENRFGVYSAPTGLADYSDLKELSVKADGPAFLFGHHVNGPWDTSYISDCVLFSQSNALRNSMRLYLGVFRALERK